MLENTSKIKIGNIFIRFLSNKYIHKIYKMITFGDIAFGYFIFWSVIFVLIGNYWLQYGITESFFVGWVIAIIVSFTYYNYGNNDNFDFYQR